jgi:hypothetical protein
VSSSALIPIAVAGESGDLVVLAVSLQPGWLHVPAWHGTLLLGLPLAVNAFPLGTLDGSGSKQAVLRAPKLPPGLEEASFFLQAATVDAGGVIHLAGARTVHVLASGLLP